MFTKPQHGWTNLQLGNFSERASYLTDVPIDCLDAFIYALQNKVPAVVYFDAEGWDFHLVSSYYRTYMILDKDTVEIFIYDKTIEEVAIELINNIENYFEEWVNWECYDDKSESEIAERRNLLNEKLLILKNLINIKI